jgi:hypothetical protein
LREDGDYKEEELAEFMATIFAIFYVNDVYLASRHLVFLQRALTLLVHLFERVGLQTNTTKMQTMICTPSQIRTQLSPESNRQMQRGWVKASEWNSHNVECHQFRKVLKASSLGCHLADIHDIYQRGSQGAAGRLTPCPLHGQR